MLLDKNIAMNKTKITIKFAVSSCRAIAFFVLSFCIFSAVQAQYHPAINVKTAANTLADTAKKLADNTVVYDPSYVKISYPNGDVPPKRGVCTDVIVRAFRRAFKWDLQKSVYEYRKARKLATNTNIDHRRVKNLMSYFDSVKELKNDLSGGYKKGNIIIWDLGKQLHIGICVENNVIIHNICCGQVIERMYMENLVIRNYTWQ